MVDPFAAVTTVLSTGAPPKPVAESLVIPHLTPPDSAPANRALWFVGAIGAVALLCVGPAVAVSAARRRSSSQRKSEG